MAPKPKKEVRKPTLAEQYENRRSFIIDTAETPKDKKNLKKDLAKAKSDYVNAKKDKQSRAAGTAYNPAPMSAAAKKKAADAGAKKQAAVKNPMGLKALKNDKPGLKPLNNDKPARGAKAGTSTASKVVKAATNAFEYSPIGIAAKAGKAVVKAARGGMSIQEENKKLAQTMQNIGKADKKAGKKK